MKRFAVAAAAVGAIPTLGNADILSSKRGYGDYSANYDAAQAIGAGWYYRWAPEAGNVGGYDAKEIPMFARSWHATTSQVNNIKSRGGIEWVAGFNEPERSDQANMTVAQAIDAWTNVISPGFTGTSIKVISPSVADTGGTTGGQAWLADFMGQATAASLKVDAVAFHWYGVSTPSNPAGAASSFLSRVDSYHNSYGLPVFITEFAIHDWGGVYTDAQIIEANRQFLDIVIPGLESRSYVAGYAWYNWFSDSALFSGTPLTPTPMSYAYIGAIRSGTTEDVGGKNLGEHVAYLAGGTLTQTGTAATLKYINALANTSSITGTIDWGLNSSSNWLRIQPGATLKKTGTNTITFGNGAIGNDGVLDVAQGVLRLGKGMAGTGSILISSTGDATGSTARLELTGNISVPNPVTFAQRTDPGGSDGIRNVSGTNTLSGPMTITVGGSQARVRSDSGTLNLAGPISTNATSARNFYLQGAGNGVVSGVIADNASNSAGKINLFKEGTGTWTLMATNTYSGSTNINGGVLRLAQLTGSSVTSSAIANYTFDNVSGSTVVNGGSGGSSMNGTLANGAAIVAGGQSGNAASFSSGASVNIPNSIINMSNVGNWTVSAWVKTSTAGASILTKGDGSTWGSGNTIFYLGDGSGGGSGGIPSAVRWGGGFLQGSSSSSVVTNNAWHLVTYVSTLGNCAIYVDGVAQTMSAGNSGFGNGDVGSVVRLGITTNTVTSDGTVNYSGLLDSVQFYNQALSAAQIAALFQGASIGGLPIATDVSIASGATLDVNGVVQQIASLSGPAGSSVTLGSGQLIVNSANSTQFSGIISGTGGSLVKSGNSTLTLTGTNSYSGATTINAGTLVLGPSAHAPVLSLGGAVLNGGRLIMNYNPGASPAAAIAADLATNAGSGFQAGKVRTSLAPNPTKAIGWLDDGSGTFQARYTYKGDIDLNGLVDSVDFNAFIAGYGKVSDVIWADGDSNYDGKVNTLDFNFLAGNFGLSPIATPSLGSIVPEPSISALLSMGAMGVISRRRRLDPSA